MQGDIASNPFFNGVFVDNPPASIYCSDAWEQSLRTTDIDPLDTAVPKRPISVTRPSEAKITSYDRRTLANSACK